MFGVCELPEEIVRKLLLNSGSIHWRIPETKILADSIPFRFHDEDSSNT